jgi:hypothetical protein
MDSQTIKVGAIRGYRLFLLPFIWVFFSGMGQNWDKQQNSQN